MKLHLGVIDLPYAYDQQALGKNGKPTKRTRKVRLAVTTGDVAGFLENKYHPFEIFYESRQEEIVGYLEEGLTASLEDLIAGAPPRADPFAGGCQKIEDRFKQFLANREMEALGYPGVPTQAALQGVNHRMARPYQKRASRPSFIDTSLYQTSFKAWVD